MRTVGGHIHKVELVEADPSCASTHGVKRESILNSSKYFHVIGGLPSDIMHDVLEGSLPYQVKLLLRHVINEDCLTLEEINERILNFPNNRFTE